VAKFLSYGMPADYINLEKDIYKNPDGSKTCLTIVAIL
jgi:hypothetical protein